MTNFLLFIGALVLASLLIGRSKPGFIWIVAALLVAVAGQAFSQLSWGGGFVSRIFAGVFGLFGSADAAATIAVLVLLVIVIFDVIVDKKLDKKGAAALFLIPVLLLLTSGPLASTLDGAYEALRNGIVTAVGSI